MNKRTNAFQIMVVQVSNGPLGGWEEGLAAIEISAAATPAALWCEGAYARDRELAGLIHNFNVFTENAYF